jgi:hypothetical protein
LKAVVRPLLLERGSLVRGRDLEKHRAEEHNVFRSDGALHIDNSISEREMKRVVLNRKNSLFVGNARGGRTAAILSSLTSTCRRHEVDTHSISPSCWSTCPPRPSINSPHGSPISGRSFMRQERQTPNSPLRLLPSACSSHSAHEPF